MGQGYIHIGQNLENTEYPVHGSIIVLKKTVTGVPQKKRFSQLLRRFENNRYSEKDNQSESRALKFKRMLREIVFPANEKIWNDSVIIGLKKLTTKINFYFNIRAVSEFVLKNYQLSWKFGRKPL